MKATSLCAAAVAFLWVGAVAAEEKQDEWLSVPIGMSAEVGGGAGGFIRPAATDVSGVAGTWTARLTVGTRTIVGGEVGYIGAAQGMNALGLDDKAILTANGLEGMVRLSPFTGTVQPYIVAGIGWKHYSLVNAAFNTSSVGDVDNVAEVPLGLGLAVRVGRLIGDLRGSYRQAFESKLLGSTNLSNWGVSAKVGFEF